MTNNRNQLKDDLKRDITAEKLANYIAQKEGKPIRRTHDDAFYVGDGTKISQKDDCALVKGFSGHVTDGDVFSVIAYYHGLDKDKDFSRVLELTCNEFGVPYSPIVHEVQQLNQDQKDVYNQFMKSHWERLKAGLECKSCQLLFKARGLDTFKITNFDNVGYAEKPIDCVRYSTDKNHKTTRLNCQIPANSLVFRDNKQIKVITFDKTGHRSKDKTIQQLISGAGNCHWIAAKIEQKDVYLCEGETSAIALLFQGLSAIPLKCEGDGVNIATQMERDGHRLILAYDNDKTGQELTEKAFRCLSNPIDISGLWSGDGFQDGADPNDYTAKHKLDCVTELIQSEIDRKAKETEKADAERSAILDSLKTVNDVLDYLKQKNDNRSHSDCSKRFYADELFGTFCYKLDPYGIRRFAPIACLVSYAIARLAKYTKKAGGRVLTEQRIINVCGELKSGKDWILGTTNGSRSIAYQLNRDKDNYSVSIDNTPPTGNGLARYALEFAAAEKNKGLVKVIIHPESGNALTQGYDAAKRTGSLSSFDIGLSNRRVDVPKTGTALKDFKDYDESYDFDGVCIRAYQDINAQKVIIPRFAGGGESRREMWFAITHPVNDEMCNDRNAQLFEDVLSYSFDPDECDYVYGELKKRSLPFKPESDYFGDPPKDTISIDTECEAYDAVYERLLDTVKNPYFRQDKSALIRSQFQFSIALCAGLHGHHTANENDYWCAGYIVEVLSRSLDMIAEWDSNRPENTETLHAQILEFIERAGANGVRSSSIRRKFADGMRALSELLAGDAGDGAPIFKMIDVIDKHCNAYYFGAQFRDDVEKNNRFRTPIK